jgi:hypothetical protein
MNSRRGLATVVAGAFVALLVGAAERGGPVMKTETFDRDPNWDHSNNRAAERGDKPVTIRQGFGYSQTANAGGKAGEAGGFLQAAAEPAYYGKVIEKKTLDQPFSASGTMAVADGGTNLLLGFFNASTLNEWRTPNTLAIRINGRGEYFYGYLEYCTSKWRAGADGPQAFPMEIDPKTGKQSQGHIPSGKKVHRWSITYDPAGNDGGGVITATIDERTSVCHLSPGHKADGATFDRFGLMNVNKSADNGTEVYIDDVTVNGAKETFDADPKWDGQGNNRVYETNNVRPRFDFGYSVTNFAGGKGKGEMGGLTFRGDCRYPERMAYYGDKVGPLSLDKPIKASGKVVMLRGVSDSTTLFGFFDAKAAMRSNPSQSSAVPEGVLGVNIEGPSSEGFCFYPLYRLAGGNDANVRDPRQSPRIHPDRKPHDWSLEYDPAGADGRGRITVKLDDGSATLDLKEGERQKASAARFDHFGLVTPWVDGNAQTVYFDDITYSVSQ